MMPIFIKCLSCGMVHEHSRPIPLPNGDAKHYLCTSCRVLGQVRILRGADGMFTDVEYTHCTCGKLLDRNSEVDMLYGICTDCR